MSNKIVNTSTREKKTAINPTREEDFPEWYQQVVKASDMAENSPVRGCMVIKPWGYGVWELIQRYLDKVFKETGHENAYFPLFIPLSFLQKEAEHVAGFAKECAVITHHRLEEKEGRLVPAAELEEPLIVRPTSETIIGDCFARWIESYRDLPLLINQWANVVRWEMRPRVFLRTTEFLWQEGHTAHATAAEAVEETLKMHQVYRQFIEEVLAIPVILGEKSPGERFPGAQNTYTLEAMTMDRKALQMATAHDLGQNFSKAAGIKFSNKEGQLEYAYTTSWGLTTRTIGAMIMVHGDDDGIRLPPRVAPKQIVILPVLKPETEQEVLAYAHLIATRLRALSFHGQPISVHIDQRDKRGGDKSWEWIKKGVPLRIEVGPRDMVAQSAVISRRDRPHQEKQSVVLDVLPNTILNYLEEMQKEYYQQALQMRNQHICSTLNDFEELKRFFTPKNSEKPEIHGGFVRAKWCGDPKTEQLLEEVRASIRCIPLEQTGSNGKCILTGRPATLDVIIAKSY